MGKFLRNPSRRETLDALDTRENIDRDNTEVENYAEHCARAEKNVCAASVESVDAEIEDKLEITSDVELPKLEAVQESFKKKSHSENREGDKSSRRDPNRPPPKKAKLIRAERREKKLLARGKLLGGDIDAAPGANVGQNVAKSVEDFFSEIDGGVEKLETKLVSVVSNEFLETVDVSANLYKKYQMAIHGNTADKCDKKSFLSFLVKSPLQPYSPPDGPPQGYGSFHEQYWLSGQLIAVAVIDILPLSVSSVYFFYDPDYSFLSLGTFSSLREVCLTRQLNKLVPSIKYYYLGFYIHSNLKMRYKAKMKPSKLLCPETYVWCDLDASIAKLNQAKYSRLNDDIDAIDRDATVNISKVLVLNHRRVMTYGTYGVRDDEESVREYATLVGAKCAQRMLLYRE